MEYRNGLRKTARRVCNLTKQSLDRRTPRYNYAFPRMAEQTGLSKQVPTDENLNAILFVNEQDWMGSRRQRVNLENH